MRVDIPNSGAIWKYANALAGNILMISEGRSGTDNVFSLRDGLYFNPIVIGIQLTLTPGTLRLELGRELLERTGLTGKPIRSGGRKHAKERFRT